MKVTYERMTSEINILFKRVKRDVRLSRQYMFLLRECELEDLLNLDDKIAIK